MALFLHDNLEDFGEILMKETGAARLVGEQFGRERMSEILFVVAQIAKFPG